MNLDHVIPTCASGRWHRRLASAHPLAWLALLAAAHGVHWRWAAARLGDGSDDPLGVAAAAVLGWALLRQAGAMRAQPRLPWLWLSMGLSVAATAAVWWLPPLAGALLAALALVCGTCAFLPSGAAALPLAGLAVLALPLVSSMQFYAGFPLRVATAEASTWLLKGLGFAAERSGSAMAVDGRLIIVDAPCSGVQMVWMAYFCACATALWAGLRDAAFARRLPGVGALVLLGNVLRNSVLVGLEAQGQPVEEWLHQAVGLAVLAGVCAGVCGLMRRPAGQASATATPPGGPRGDGPWHIADAAIWRKRANLATASSRCLPPPARRNRRGWPWQWAVLPALLACLAAPWALPGSDPVGGGNAGRVDSEWPREWEGRALRPLALSPVEQRFAAHFPGQLTRLTDGVQTLVWREVHAPTRMLHPAADCYRGLGYRIENARLERDAQDRLWRCFVAERTGPSGEKQRIRVCERIVDATGRSFTDTSSWFWSAQLGQSTGPWQALTIARAL